MESSFERIVYGWSVAMMGMTALSSIFMVISPGLFVAIQRRLINLVGYPEEIFAPFWQKVPLRLVGAVNLVLSLGALYYLLVVNPDVFVETRRRW